MALADTYDDLLTANALCGLRRDFARTGEVYVPGFESCSRVASAYRAARAKKEAQDAAAADLRTKDAVDKALSEIGAAQK